MEETISLEQKILDIAKEKTGFPDIRPLQLEAIKNTLSASDENQGQIVILPTGYGKTLCFTLPAFLGIGITVIIYPLTALIADQKRRFEKYGLPCYAITGNTELSMRRQILTGKLAENSVLLSTPEQISHPALLPLWKKLAIGHVVFDEAHTIIKWGDTFRTACLTAVHATLFCTKAYFSVFTATAGSSTLARIREFMFDDRNIRLINTVHDKTNLFIHFYPCHSPLRFIRKKAGQGYLPMLVFSRSRKETEILCWQLRGEFDARCYHAGFEAEQRMQTESWFMNSVDGILISTCAYGMGMDKPDIRSIVHLGPSCDIESYIQECGRAGRDGKNAEAWLLFSPGREYPSPWKEFLRTKTCIKQRLYADLGYEFPDQCHTCSSCLEDTADAEIPPRFHRFVRLAKKDHRSALLSGQPAVIHGMYPHLVKLQQAPWQLDEAEEFCQNYIFKKAS